MRAIKLIGIIILIFGFHHISYSQAASCPFITPVATPSTICSGQCSDLTATALLTKTTTTYSVQSIPHAPPISYTATGGNPVSVGTDDVWSPTINLPSGFNFCFYGNVYNKILIGSNGNLSFDLADASGFCPWNFSTGTTPQNPNCPSAALVPMGNIFGVYHDIDPSKGSPRGTVNWYISGSAPCRKFIVVYNNMAHFGTSCSANTYRSTHMIVLHELTNYIDVYVNSKPLCTGWNNGNAIIGIQNLSGTQGIAAPGRNTTPVWSTTSAEAWRFVPNGAINYAITWTGPSGTIGSNTLGAINVCPTTNTTYTTSISVTNCDNAVYTFTNTVAVNVNSSSTPTFNAVNPICQGANLSALPATSTNGVNGAWSPAINNNATTTYTFTPSTACALTNTLNIVVTPTITPVFTQVPAICAGDALASLPITSNNTINGSWSPAINSASTTTYTFTPTSGQCANPTQMTISVNNNTLPTFTQVPAQCQGTAISALPTTSNNGIIGSWSPAINNSSSTTYTFTPNVNQCAIDNQMTISITPNINPTFNSINPICEGDPINLQATSNNNFSGTWLPAINNTATTTYTFTPNTAQCATTSTLSVVVNQPIVPQITGTNTICNGESTTLTASNATTYTWTPSANLNSSTGTSVVASPSANINYSVSSTDQNGCISSASFSVIVNPIPVLSTVTSQTICTGQNTPAITFNSTVTGTTVNWINNQTSIGLVASGNGNVPSFNSINAGADPVTSTIIATPTASGCLGQPQTFSITVNPIPVLSSIGSQTLCSGQNVSSIVFNSSANNTTINWTNSNSSIGLPFSGTGNLPGFTATNIDPAPIIASISASPSANGCNGLPITFTITVNPFPVLTAVNSQTICAGQNIAPINYTCNVTGATINWTNTETAIGLTANGIGNIAVFSGVNTGTSPLTSTVTATPTANGCPGTSVTFSITVKPVPTLNSINNQTVCAGEPVNGILYTTSLSGATVSWSNSEIGIGLSANGTGDITGFNALNSGNTSLTSVINATASLNGCSGVPQTYTIIVHPIPVLTAINSQTLCAGEPVSAINYSSTVSGSLINWNNTESGIGLPLSGTDNIASFTSTNTGNSPLIAIITATPSANTCSGLSQTFTITVNNQVLPDFTQVPAVCDGGVLSPLPLTSTNNVTGVWSPSINNSITTTYTFTPTIGQCATTTNMTIGVGSNVVPIFDQVNPICAGGILSDLPTVSNNALTGSWNPPVDNFITTTYTFTPTPNQCGLTTQMTIQVNLPVTPQFTAINPFCAGEFIGALSSTSDNGITGLWLPPINNLTTTTYTFTPSGGTCATVATTQILIYPKPSLSDVTPTDETCGASNGVLTVNSINGGTAPYQYSLNNAAFVSSNSFTTLVSGTYVIIVKDANSCSDTISTSITNYPGPNAAQLSTTDANCGLATGSITVEGVSGGTAPYQYNFNNTGFTSSPTINQLNTGNFSVIIKDANGCILDSIIQVTGDGQVNADFTLTPLVGTVPVWASFTNTSSTPSAQFIWNLGLTTIDTVAFQPNPQIYDVYGTYAITLIATNGNPACNDTVVKFLKVELDPFIIVPNIFSPNGDGNNDEFFIQSRGYIDLKVTIFNRWGNIINSFDGVLGNWDGKDSSGNEVSAGTYYYFISGKRYDSEPFEAHGYMMLVR